MTRFSLNLMTGLALSGALLSASLAMADNKKGLNAAARRSVSSNATSSASFKKLSTGGATNQMSQSQNLGNSGLSFKKGSLNQVNRNLNLGNSVTSNSGLALGNKNLITNRGQIADAVKNGNLTPIGGNTSGNTGTGGITFPGRNVIVDRGRLADLIKDGGLKPIGDGNGGGNPGGGLPPGLGTIIDRGRIADIIKDGGLKPIDDNPPVADPGNNPPANPPADPPADPPVDPPHCPPKNDCHPCFPWFPVFVGGTYNWCPTPVYTGVTVVQQPVVQTVAVAAPAAAASVDLVLVDVRLVDAGDAARKLGPRFRLFFQNRGTLAVDNFQVVIMATKEAKPAADAPTASAEVARLGAGELGSADVRLPLATDLSALPVLLAGIDSAMQIDELDEANNVAALERAKIAAAE